MREQRPTRVHIGRTNKKIDTRIAKKRTKQGIFLLLCLLTVPLILLSGCGKTALPRDCAHLRERGFSAEARGIMGGQELRMLIRVEKKDGTLRQIRAEFVSPPVLEGVCVLAEARLGLRGSSEAPVLTAVQIERGDITLSAPPAATRGLLAPATTLFSLTTPTTVQRGSNTHTLTFEKGIVLVLSDSGVPISLSTPDLNVTFHNWTWE